MDTRSRAKLLQPAQTLPRARKSAAEAALSDAIEQQRCAAQRVTDTQRALEAEQRERARAHCALGSHNALELRRHAAHARAVQARLRALAGAARAARRAA